MKHEVPDRAVDLLEATSEPTIVNLPSGKRMWIISEDDKLALDRLKAAASRAVCPEDEQTQHEGCQCSTARLGSTEGP